jgi:alpha-L-fucosidase
VIRRTLVLAFALLVTLPAAAAAQEYPPQEGQATVSDSSVPPGGTFTLSGSGCAPSSQVAFGLDQEAQGQVTADSAGAFSAQVTVPEDTTAGQHEAVAVCETSEGETLVLSATITVEGAAAETPRGTAGAGALPATGQESSVPLTKIAVMLVLVGGAFVVAARRRSTPVAERISR